MPVYTIKWTMKGVVRIEAPTPEEASAAFDEWFLNDIAETHDDFDVEPPVAEQLEESHG